MNDIEHTADIKTLVDHFYKKVQGDVLIGPIFIGVIKNNWQPHLEKMYRFWETVLLNEHTYHGSPFPPHAQMPLKKQHFETWLRLFHATVDEYFEGPKAEEAKRRADMMASVFLSKIEYYQSQPGQKPIM